LLVPYWMEGHVVLSLPYVDEKQQNNISHVEIDCILLTEMFGISRISPGRYRVACEHNCLPTCHNPFWTHSNSSLWSECRQYIYTSALNYIFHSWLVKLKFLTDRLLFATNKTLPDSQILVYAYAIVFRCPPPPHSYNVTAINNNFTTVMDEHEFAGTVARGSPKYLSWVVFSLRP
jgi:hypothetical protein